MGIDYILQVPCPIRKEMNDEEIKNLKKQEYFLNVITAQNPNISDDTEIQGIHMIGDNTFKSLMTMGFLKEKAELYKQLGEKYCKDCKYNRNSPAMDCLGRLNYPIFMANEMLIFQLIVDNLHRFKGKKDPFIKSLVEDYPKNKSTQIIAVSRQKGQMLENLYPIQSKPSKKFKDIIFSECIWASYFFPQDSPLDSLMLYSKKTLKRLYNHAKFMILELSNQIQNSMGKKDINELTQLEDFQIFFEFLKIAHEENIPFLVSA